jgi:hypothetical protein
MAIQFACKCGKNYQAQEDQIGKKTQCPCGKLLIVPRPGAKPLPPMVIVDTVQAEFCTDCGAMFMPHRMVDDGGDPLCRPCQSKRWQADGPAKGKKVSPRRRKANLGSLWVWFGLGAGVVALVALTVVLILR